MVPVIFIILILLYIIFLFIVRIIDSKRPNINENNRDIIWVFRLII